MWFKYFRYQIERYLHWIPRGTLRLRWARAAAKRGVAAALRAETDDPVVLCGLGMHAAALRNDARDKPARVAHLHALAAVGRTNELLAGLANIYRLPTADTHEMARALAPHDARAALALAHDAAPGLRAALALAGGMAQFAKDIIGDRDDRESLAIRAAIASRQEEWRQARALLNSLFTADGLAPPLAEDIDRSIALEDFLAGSAALTPCVGSKLVSVIVPVKNPDIRFATSIDSLIHQTWRTLEILIVVDGDDPRKMSDALGRRIAGDPRVVISVNTQAPGAAGARNSGLAAARGDVLVFHDADDWMHPQRIERHMQLIGTADAIVSQHVRLTPHGRIMTPRVTPLIRLSPACLTLRRATSERIGPLLPIRTGSDSEYLARLDLRCRPGRVIRDKKLFTIASWREGSLSADAATGLFGAAGQIERAEQRSHWLRRHAGLRVD